MNITIITPNLPPIMCGLADHSRLFGEAIEEQGCTINYIGLHGKTSLAQHWPGTVAKWDGKITSLATLLDEQSSEWVWLQLSGYGYSKLGAPWKLYLALKNITYQLPSVKLAVCLHETYCKPGQLGKKGFILSHWQKYIICAISRLANLILPTVACRISVCADEFGIDNGKIKLLPIVANIPKVELTLDEKENIRSNFNIKSNQKVAVIFGTQVSQEKAINIFFPLITKKIEQGSIDYLLIIGGGIFPSSSMLNILKQNIEEDKFYFTGQLSEYRVAELLEIADIGLVPTPWDYWKKSGAARAFEQAGMELWIIKEEKLNIIPPSLDVPVWESVAQQALGWMNDSIK